jgi:hypothetical protein
LKNYEEEKEVFDGSLHAGGADEDEREGCGEQAFGNGGEESEEPVRDLVGGLAILV